MKLSHKSVSVQTNKNNICKWQLLLPVSNTDLKGVVCESNPEHFLSNSKNISSRAASFPFCVH